MSDEFQDMYNRVATTCIGLSLRRASRVVSQFYDHMLRPCGLRMTQFTLLISLARSGPQGMDRLSRRMFMDRTTLGRNIRPLERMGLIALESGEDRRRRIVRITGQGQEALREAFPLWEAAQASMEERLGRDRWASLHATLAQTTVLMRLHEARATGALAAD